MQYDRLPNLRSIRLLALLPADAGHGVACRLSVHSLDDRPIYIALSYVWGPPVFDHNITCNKHTFAVTQSLHRTLKALQQDAMESLLWIDQICINQDDLDERSQQVRLMRDIYIQATSVLCSLGEADGDTRVMWDILSIVEQAEEKQSLYRHDSLSEAAKLETVDLSSSDLVSPQATRRRLPSVTSEKWKAVQRFLRKPWFARCWTYQEALLGLVCNLRCGTFEVSFDTFHAAITTLFNAGYGDLMGRGHWAVSGIGLQREYLQSKQSGPQMAYMLSVGRDRQSSNPRDKVYAFLGVTHRSSADLVTIDYSRSVDEVYADAVRACIQGAQNLEILTHVEVRRYDGATLPTWVPDWRHLESTRVAYGIRTRYAAQYFKTSGALRPLLSNVQDWRKLKLKGFLLAPITSFRNVKDAIHLTDPCISNNSLNSERWDARDWIQLYRSAVDTLGIPQSCARQSEVLDPFTKYDFDLHNASPSFEHRLQAAFRRTVTADLHPLSPGRETAEQCYAAYNSWRLSGFAKPIPPQVLLEHDRHVSDVMFQREFFIAGSEPDCYMGAALGTIKLGDWVCVLAGGDTPYVLRPRDQVLGRSAVDVDEWEFVHDCYIHGVMYGEALCKLEEPSFRWKDFTLV